MPIQIIRNDITKMRVDAIVNAANSRLLSGGGVCGAIHQAAGPELQAECMTIGSCPAGQARITGAYRLPCRYVIHTVGPVWQGGSQGEQALLASCYRESLRLAQAHGCTSVAFPLISSGVFGYPKDQAFKVAMDSIGAYLLSGESDGDMTVFLVIYGRNDLQIGSRLFSGIQQYIDDHYVDAHTDYRWESIRAQRVRDITHSAPAKPKTDRPVPKKPAHIKPSAAPPPSDFFAPTAPADHFSGIFSLEEALSMIDESFSQMVLRKIREKGMKNSDCYKRANIDKKLFSKINNDIHYKPKKSTALAIAVALELSLDETRELLTKAGLALSRSDKFDIIVEYFITQGKYDIFEINEALFCYDQILLGGAVL